MKLGALLPVVLLVACGGAEEPETGAQAGTVRAADSPDDLGPATASPAIPTGLALTDRTAGSGLDYFRQENGDAEKLWILETIGGGVALFDADLDGRLDVYLANGGYLDDPDAEPPRDALYLNRGELRFEEAAASFGLGSTGWTMGAFACDLDADGRSDLYLTAWGRNTLYRRGAGERGGHHGGFLDATQAAGVGDTRWSTGACFVDHDRDGDLDLYVANYVVFDADDRPTERQSYQGVEVHFGPRGMQGARDTFYRNRGDGTFADVTEELDVGSTGFGFQAVALDYDDDGFTDVFVGNDSTPNRLWHNDAGAGFTDRSFETGVALSRSGMEQAAMGVAVGDVDADGRLDLYVTNFSEDYHTLYRGTGGGLFSDRTLSAGLVGPTLPLLGWGTGIVDLDADGAAEILAVNGHIYPQVDRFEFATRYRQPNQLFRADERGRFTDVAAHVAPALALPGCSRGLAWGDLDDDGDLDLIVTQLDAAPTLLANETARPGATLVLDLVGAGANRDAVGATVRVRAGGRTQAFAAGSSSSFLSTADRRLFVGIGEESAAEEIVVRWATGREQTFADVPAGHVVSLVEGRAEFELLAR